MTATGTFPTYALRVGDTVRLIGSQFGTNENNEQRVIKVRPDGTAESETYYLIAGWSCQLVERDGKRVKSVVKASSGNLRIEFVNGTFALFTVNDHRSMDGAWANQNVGPDESSNTQYASGTFWTLLYEIETKEDEVTRKFEEGDRVTIAKGAKSLYARWPDGGEGKINSWNSKHQAWDVTPDKGVQRIDGETYVCDGEWSAVFKPQHLTLLTGTPETATDAEIDAALAKIKAANGYCSEFDRAVDAAKIVPSYLSRLEAVANDKGHPDLYDELVKELTPERKVKWPKGTKVKHIHWMHSTPRTTVKDYYEGDSKVYYTHHNGAPDNTLPERLIRVYVVGDTLPAGEPVPANGVMEYPNGDKRYYEEKGAPGTRFDRKIIWLEDEA